MAGVEPSFGMNSFNQARYKNESETVVNAILALLFGRPGFFPSMPELGINIQDSIYGFWDEISPNALKAQISTQCSAFKEFIDDGTLDVVKTSYNDKPMLLIVLPVEIQYTKEKLAIGITTDSDGNTIYNYVFDYAY